MSTPGVNLAEKAQAIWRAGVEAVQPSRLVAAAMAAVPMPEPPGRLVVVGMGKAGAAMASAAEAALGPGWTGSDRLAGWVNVPADTIAGVPSTRRITLHPARDTPANVPTAAGVAGARRIVELVRGCGPADVCVVLISGGGSALLPLPAEGLSLEAKQAVTKRLAACGATINEINSVRKHLSAVKGGRLAGMFRGRAMVSLIISDVIGDPLDVIASGPTAPDPTTFADALAVIERYRLAESLPAEVVHHLREGVAGRREETPKSLPPTVTNRIVGSPAVALAAARRAAEAMGLPVSVDGIHEGDTAELARAAAGRLAGRRGPFCEISGGETTVNLGPNPGKGGRNQEFALAVGAALGRNGLRGMCVLSGGTDGEDGPTDAAGAWVDEAVMAKAAELGLDPADFLARHDAYRFFERAGGLFKTGPTGTNVMDLRVVLREAP
jgi:hydroxypyruvate reductase/glycerate 2-kinase